MVLRLFLFTMFAYLYHMASALDIISLQQAKDFLVIDFPDRDAEITRHIKAAIGYIEKYTNHMLYQRPKDYVIDGCSLEIYDYPLEVSTTVDRVHNNVLSKTYYAKSGTVLNATVGYSNPDNIPEELIEAAYKLITYLTENKDIYTAGLPWDVQMLVNKWRRSATI